MDIVEKIAKYTLQILQSEHRNYARKNNVNFLLNVDIKCWSWRVEDYGHNFLTSKYDVLEQKFTDQS